MIERDHLKAYLFLILTTLCWGLNAIISRLAVGEIAPMQLVTFRWLGVVLLLFFVARKRMIEDWPVLRQHLPYLGLMGAFGFTVFNALFYAAGHHTTAINIGILQGSIPIFVFIGSFLFFRHKMSLIQVIGVVITLIGVIVVTIAGDFAQLSSLSINRGDFFMLIACLFYAGYSGGLRLKPTE
ncbi:MAG: DMT family transporter [Pseudomonadota bacterium]